MGDKHRGDAKDAVERVVHELNKLTADGYVVSRVTLDYDLGKAHKHGPKLPLGATLSVELTPIT